MRTRSVVGVAVRVTVALLLVGATLVSSPTGSPTRAAMPAQPGGASPMARHASPSVAGPIDGPLTQLPGSVPAATVAHLRTMRAPASASAQLRHVTITLVPRNVAALRQLVETASDPSSPRYRQFLSDAQFLRDYAPSQQTYDQFKEYLTGQGLAVSGQDRLRLVLQVSGTRRQLDAAFHTTSVYGVNVQGIGGYVNATPLWLPASLAAQTAAVTGFDETQRNRTFLRREPLLAHLSTGSGSRSRSARRDHDALLRSPLSAGDPARGPLRQSRSLAAGAGAAGTTYYVSPDGDGTTCLSLQTACTSITAALAKATSGADTILIEPGTYTEAITLSVSVTLRRDPDAVSPDPVMLQGASTTASGPSLITAQQQVTATLDHLSIGGNVGGDYGGGINNAGTLTVTSSTFSGDNATNGGAIYNSGVLSVMNSTFGENAAEGGGNIFNLNGGTMSVTNSTFSGSDGYTGAGIFNGGTLTVTNSTFSGNSANYFGGAIDNDGTLSVANSTFSGNSAYNGDGGAIHNGGTLTVTNSTVDGNRAGHQGGGIASASGTARVVNTLLAENRSDSGTGPECSGTLTSLGYNLVGDTSGCTFTPTTGDEVGTANSPIDPRMSSLASNGGPTQTNALLPGSPAVGAGNPATCASSPVNGKDQRGRPRPGVAVRCSIGAFEPQTSDPGFTVRSFGVHDPAALRAAYQVPAHDDGTGTTVAVVLWRQPMQDDLNTWNSIYPTFAFSGTITPISAASGGDPSLPAVCPAASGNLTVVCTTGQAQSGLDPQDDAEANLDATAVHVIAPEAQILFSLAPGPDDADLEMALTNAISYQDAGGHHVAAISISWGSPCDTGKYAAVHAGYDALFLSAQALGIPVVVASGDTGIFCAGPSSQRANTSTPTNPRSAGSGGAAATPSVSATATPPLTNPLGYAAAPANSQWVLAVGGTSLSMDPTTFAWRGESAWSCTPGNDSTCMEATGGASGGGLSGYAGDGQPSWQRKRISPPDGQFDPSLQGQQYTQRRAVPDISADGDPATGLAYVDGGNLTTAGGTSAAAPWVAGALALATQAYGHNLGFVTPFLYARCPAAAWCNDVTVGYNGEPSRAGWDYTTGLGSIKDYGGFVAALAGAMPPTPVPTYTPTVTATPTPAVTSPMPSATATGTASSTPTATASPALTLFVNGADGSDTGPCQYAKPCKTIQYAIDQAGSSDAAICLENPTISGSNPPHCHTPNAPLSNLPDPSTVCNQAFRYLDPNQFCYTEDVVIHAGQELTIKSDHDVVVLGGPAGRSITVQSGATATINGLAMTMNASTLPAVPCGGIANAGSLTLTNSFIGGCHTGGTGGGIFNQGTLTVGKSILSGNSADEAGGGIFNLGALTLTDSTISGNSASGPGGGIFNQGALTLTGSTISGNSTSGPGGGIVNAGTLATRGSTITINNATGAGGGIFNEPAGVATLDTSTVGYNDAEQGGGGISNAGRFSILDTALTGNTTEDGSGGGILDHGSGSLMVANSTLLGNTTASPVGNGGGIASVGSASVTLLNATVSGNSAPHGAGGGIDHDSSGALLVENTILSANAARAVANADCAGTAGTGGYDLISAGDGCAFVATDQYAGPPTPLGSLPRAVSGFSYHGGATETLPLAPDSADSNAVHHGDPVVCQAAPIDGTDQRGLPRGPQCDIGAYDTFGDGFASTTFYVDQARGNDQSGCTSPGTGACKTVGAALALASGGGTITIAPGVYQEHLAIGQSYISLEGSGPGVVLDGSNAGTVVTVEPGVTINLAGLVIRHGTTGGNGGGIANYGTVSLLNSAVSNSEAGSERFSDGVTPGEGGGIYNRGTLLISQSTLSANTAKRFGGGVANYFGALRIRDNSLVNENEATYLGTRPYQSGEGGGIWNLGGAIFMTDSAISNNQAVGSNPPPPPATCEECTIPAGGGIANNVDSVLLLKRGTISGNHGGEGDGIYSLGATELVNATVSNNFTDGSESVIACGGGIDAVDGTVSMLATTVTGNSVTPLDAARTGCSGGIYVDSGGTVALELINTIVLLNAGNQSYPDCGLAKPSAGAPVGGYNNLFSKNGDCKTTDDGANVRADPAAAHLDPLGNYGGPTQSVRLRPGSPAIGVGDSQVCASVPVDSVDQRGMPRPQGTCDIGAYDTYGDTQSFTVQVQPGWNLISVPLTPTTVLSASAVLADVQQSSGSSVTAIYGLTSNQWSPSRVAQGGTQRGPDFPMQASQGYLLYSDRAGSFTETGGVPPGTAAWPLAVGWNLVGVPRGAPTALVASMVLDGVLAGAGKAGLAAIFGLTGGQWSPYRIAQGGAQSGMNFILAEGRGYLLYSTRSVTYPLGAFMTRIYGHARAGPAPLPDLPAPPLPPVAGRQAVR